MIVFLYIALTLLIASLVLFITVSIRTIGLINDAKKKSVASTKCLYDLVDKLNELFPNSTLAVDETKDTISVTGTLNYLTKDERI